MFCPKCGSPVIEDARFCERCGAGLSTVGRNTGATAAKKNSTIVIGLSVGLGVIIIALIVVLIFVINGSSNGSSKTVPVAEQSTNGSENTGGAGQNSSDEENVVASEAPTATPEPTPSPEPTTEPTPEPEPTKAPATASGKVSMYVLNKITTYDMLYTKISYTDEGLVKKTDIEGEYIGGGAWWDSCNYKYGPQNRIVKVKGDARMIHETRSVFHYNGKRKLSLVKTKRQQIDSDFVFEPIITKIQYNRKGQISKAGKESYQYNKKGKITKINIGRKSIKIKYDKHSNIKQVKGKGKNETFKNKYKNGLLIKRDGIIKYTYKKIRVKKKLVKKIKAQQWSLKNADLNNAFVFFSGYSYCEKADRVKLDR